MKARVGTLFVTLLVVAAATVVLPAAATGATGRRAVIVDRLTPGNVAPASPAVRGVEPIGPFTIGGTVLDYDGAPLDDAMVEWSWYDPNAPVWFGPDVVYHDGDLTYTDVGGAFSFAGVTSVPGSDGLSVYPADEEGFILASWANDFSTQSGYVIRPGRVSVTLTGFPERARAAVTVGDAATGSATTWTRLSVGHAYAAASPPGFSTVMIERDDAPQGRAALDWTSPGGVLLPVTPGETSAQEIVLDWAEARRGRLAGPQYRHAARPGDEVTFVLTHWPAGYQASFWGMSWAGDGGMSWFDTTATSTSVDQPLRVRLRIPADAPLQESYEVGAYRSDDPKSLLYLYDSLQLCRISASRDVVARGQAVRLRGVAYGYGPLVLFKRTKPAPRPATVTARGWTRVGSLTRSNGRFTTPWMRPSRTTWYTVRYRGPEFTVFTPVVKVTVQ